MRAAVPATALKEGDVMVPGQVRLHTVCTSEMCTTGQEQHPGQSNSKPCPGRFCKLCLLSLGSADWQAQGLNRQCMLVQVNSAQYQHHADAIHDQATEDEDVKIVSLHCCHHRPGDAQVL